MDIIIRATEPNDAAGIHQLYEQPKARRETLKLPFKSEHFWANRLDRIPPHVISIVAISKQSSGPTVLGNASLNRFEGRREHCAFLGIAVHDEYHHQGIGTQLMQHLIDYADLWTQIRRIELTVFTDNLNAIALYKKLAFKEEGILKHYAMRNGELMDVVAMARVKAR